jgi:ankyrin repeat protein
MQTRGNRMNIISIRNFKHALFTLIVGFTVQQHSVHAAGLIRQKMGAVVTASLKTAQKPIAWVANSKLYRNHPWFVKGASMAVTVAAAPILYKRYTLYQQNKARQRAFEKSLADNEAFIAAVARGDLSRVRELLARGVSIDAFDSRGYTALMVAVENGHLAIVQELINKGIRKDNYWSERALCEAAQQKQLLIVEEFLRYGIKLEDTCKYVYAATYDEIQKTVQEVQYKIDGKKTEPMIETGINAKDRDGNSALMLAVKNNDEPLVKQLVIMGADVAAKNNAGEIPLIVAINMGSVPVVNALLNGGADVATKDRFGDSALACAIDGGYVSVVQALVKTGHADVNTKNRIGTPLLILAMAHTALSYRRTLSEAEKVSLVQTLIGAGARLDMVDHQGNTPLHIAVLGRSAQVVRVLIDAGADLHVKNSRGETPLIMAISQSDRQITAILTDTASNKYSAHIKSALTNSVLGIGNSQQRSPIVDIVMGYLFE